VGTEPRCVVCGKPVVGKKAGALYCSPECRRAAAVRLRTERRAGRKPVKRGARLTGLRPGQVRVLDHGSTSHPVQSTPLESYNRQPHWWSK